MFLIFGLDSVVFVLFLTSIVLFLPFFLNFYIIFITLLLLLFLLQIFQIDFFINVIIVTILQITVFLQLFYITFFPVFILVSCRVRISVTLLKRWFENCINRSVYSIFIFTHSSTIFVSHFLQNRKPFPVLILLFLRRFRNESFLLLLLLLFF